ncbi:hypothetical protein ACFFGY_22360 [Roseomonas elaeocarpi]|uniref:Uncharacterized protein n=2 Tax=Roseomonas elaeocarpi TaxID=907779 RepID=A0ABV6K2I4_9PROT
MLPTPKSREEMQNQERVRVMVLTQVVAATVAALDGRLFNAATNALRLLQQNADAAGRPEDSLLLLDAIEEMTTVILRYREAQGG